MRDDTGEAKGEGDCSWTDVNVTRPKNEEKHSQFSW
jgi:hypothetical protein